MFLNIQFYFDFGVLLCVTKHIAINLIIISYIQLIEYVWHIINYSLYAKELVIPRLTRVQRT